MAATGSQEGEGMEPPVRVHAPRTSQILKPPLMVGTAVPPLSPHTTSCVLTLAITPTRSPSPSTASHWTPRSSSHRTTATWIPLCATVRDHSCTFELLLLWRVRRFSFLWLRSHDTIELSVEESYLSESKIHFSHFVLTTRLNSNN